LSKYQIEQYFLCGGWENVETDGDGNKVYYSTEQEAQDFINGPVKEWNDEIDSGHNQFGTYYSVDEYRVVKVKD